MELNFNFDQDGLESEILAAAKRTLNDKLQAIATPLIGRPADEIASVLRESELGDALNAEGLAEVSRRISSGSVPEIDVH